MEPPLERGEALLGWMGCAVLSGSGEGLAICMKICMKKCLLVIIILGTIFPLNSWQYIATTKVRYRNTAHLDGWYVAARIIVVTAEQFHDPGDVSQHRRFNIGARVNGACTQGGVMRAERVIPYGFCFVRSTLFKK